MRAGHSRCRLLWLLRRGLTRQPAQDGRYVILRLGDVGNPSGFVNCGGPGIVSRQSERNIAPIALYQLFEKLHPGVDILSGVERVLNIQFRGRARL
jgi:hypothetical protein